MSYKKNRFDELLNILSNDILKKRELARTNFIDFIKYIKGDSYDMTEFHKTVIGFLDNFNYTSSSRMMLFAPPQRGKSELSSRLLPAFTLGQSPDKKIAILCYAQTIAQGFSKDVQSIISSPEYRELFPETIIDGVGIKKGKLKRNSYEFHTSEGGYLISVGVGGALTSKTVDIAIIDDLYKSHEDAWSHRYRERVQSWYWSVLETRLHNDSKVLILFTRWHMQDLAGHLLKEEPDVWQEIKFEALKTKDTLYLEYDKRKIGEVLWEKRHNLESVLRWKERDPIAFQSLGQQNPKPKEGLMYPKHNTYKELPNFEKLGGLAIRKAQIDTADEGKDYLCGVTYIEYDGLCYITEIYYTQEAMEITELGTAELIHRNNTQIAIVESNNGGKGFSREVRRYLSNLESASQVEWFSQRANKEAKIFSNSAKVMNRVLFPEFWEDLYEEAYESFVNYTRSGKNEHDDLQDVLSEMVSRIETGDLSGEESYGEDIIIG